jgi:hypothetical protein
MLKGKINQAGKHYTNVILSENANAEGKKELTYFAKDNF